MFEKILFAAVFLPIGLYLLLKLKIFYFPALFFAIKFAAGQVLNFDRVRNNVLFQLLIITILLGAIAFRSHGKLRIGDKFFFRSISAILPFLMFYSITGVLNGHGIFQIFIDCYKYLEIIVYYILLRASWKDNRDVFMGVRALSGLMLSLGLIEVVITSRGGVGLNLMISLFPMVMILALYRYLSKPKTILLITLFVVVSCQTRTYIMGFVIGLAAMMFALPKDRRQSLMTFTFAIGILAVIVAGVFGGELLKRTLSRFMELASGFEESGGYRIYDYAEAINRFLDHPILGNGFGYLKRTYILKMGWMNWGDFVHCLYLEILFKVGICGVVYIAVVFGRFIRKIYRNAKALKGKDDMVFAICCGGLCSFLSWFFIYMFAPLATIGSMFLGPLIASIALTNYYTEQKSMRTVE